MNNDLISREYLLNQFADRARSARSWKENALNNGNEESAIRADAVLAFLIEVKLIIDNAPTVEERQKGEWIEHQDCFDDTYYTCSHCGEDWITIEGKPTDNLMNYCPMCGADMRGDNND